MITTSAGIAGKNRNVPAAVILSIVSCILGLVLSSLALDYLGNWMLATLNVADKPDDSPAWVNWLALAGEGLGCLIAVLAAGLFARSMVRDSKFCEDCEEYM